MIRVLFVCLGNICRSPLAEGIFRHRAQELGLAHNFFCDSAGTHDYHRGNQPDGRSVDVALKNGIALDHKARKVVLSDFNDFDYFFVMDDSVMDFIQNMQPKASKAKLLYMRNFDPNMPNNTVVPDPYYGGVKDFEEVFLMLDAAVGNLLDLKRNNQQWSK